MTFIDAFEKVAIQQPQAVALIDGEVSMTYAALDEAAALLAGILTKFVEQEPNSRAGVVFVGICLERGIRQVVALLAVLKCGYAYIPVSSRMPAHRQALLLADCQPVVLIVEESGRAALDALIQHIALPTRVLVDLPELDERPKRIRRSNASPVTVNNLAYVIYTSGSTGRPKGVMIDNSAFAACINDFRTFLGQGPTTVLSLTDFSFDIFGLEYGIPLCSGGSLILTNASRFHEDLARHADCVDLIQQTPTTFRLLLGDLAADWRFPHIKVLIGGEMGDETLFRRILMAFGELIQCYGPTETCIWSSCKRYLHGPANNIGRALPSEHIRILREDGGGCEAGELGEICIGGAGLARGYLNQSTLTLQKFVTLPELHTLPAGVYYKTGDLGFWDEKGELHIVGRRDNQIKLNGHRIELGEIETALLEHADIAAGAVMLDKPFDQAPHDAIIAYYFSDNAALGFEDIRLHLAQRVPSYMVPSYYVRLSEVQTTVGGKLDRASLPRPGAVSGSEALLRLLAQPKDWAAYLSSVEDEQMTLADRGITSVEIPHLNRAMGAMLDMRALTFSINPYTTLAQLRSIPLARPAPVAASPAPVSSYPATFAQARFFNAQALLDTNDRVSFCFSFGKCVSSEQIVRLAERLLTSNDAFRTAILKGDQDTIVCRIGVAGSVFKLGDVSNYADALRSFNHKYLFDQGDVARIGVGHCGGRVFMLLNVFHGMIDGFSKCLLVEDILQYLGSGEIAVRPAFSAYAQAERDQYATFSQRLMDMHWRLANRYGLKPNKLRADRPTQSAGRMCDILLSSATSGNIALHVQTMGITTHQFFVAATSYVLSTLGHHDLNVMSPVANRQIPEAFNTIGCFINVMVIKTSTRNCSNIKDAILEGMNGYMDAVAFSDIPFQLINREHPGYGGDVVVVGGVNENFDMILQGREVIDHDVENIDPCAKNVLTVFYDGNATRTRLRILFNRSCFTIAEQDSYLAVFRTVFESEFSAQPSSMSCHTLA